MVSEDTRAYSIDCDSAKVPIFSIGILVYQTDKPPIQRAAGLDPRARSGRNETTTSSAIASSSIVADIKLDVIGIATEIESQNFNGLYCENVFQINLPKQIGSSRNCH